MSLDGLDAREVNEAYASALGEGGGWYVSLITSRSSQAHQGCTGSSSSTLDELRWVC